MCRCSVLDDDSVDGKGIDERKEQETRGEEENDSKENGQWQRRKSFLPQS